MNQGEVLRGGISRIYLSLLNKWKPCHGAINSWPRNLRTALEKWKNTFDFTEVVNNYGLKRGTVYQIERFISKVFSETIHIILKIFSQYGLRKCR